MVKESVIPIGLVASEKFDVTNEDAIAAQVAADLPPVLGTFALMKWMESVAGYMVRPYLHEGRLSVGAQIDVEHLAPSPVGQKVHIEVIRPQICFHLQQNVVEDQRYLSRHVYLAQTMVCDI